MVTYLPGSRNPPAGSGCGPDWVREVAHDHGTVRVCHHLGKGGNPLVGHRLRRRDSRMISITRLGWLPFHDSRFILGAGCA